VSRVAQSLLGALLVLAGLTLAGISVTSKGAVVMEWPLASICLTALILGGFFLSKSLMVEAIKTVADAARRSKASAPKP
jgi:hypothetical protein